MTRRPAVLGLILLVPLFGGCLSDDAGAPVEGAPGDLPVLKEALSLLEEGAMVANIDRLADFEVGGGQEVDAWGDYLAVMQNPSLLIVNISDPEFPELVSKLTLAGVLDVKWSDDGEYIFVGNDAEGSVPAAGEAPQDGGLYVIDAHDKANPVVKSFLPVGPERGPHMVGYHRMPDGSEIVTGANADISVSTFDRASGTLTQVATYRTNIATGVDRSPERIDALYGVPGWAHDMFLHTEPDGRVFMYVANWDAGLRIVDVTDPSDPTEVGAWMDYPEGHSGNLHTVSTLWMGDRRITVGSPELGFSVVGGVHYAMGDELTGVYVWDTTDPANIQLLSYWSHPDEECRYAGRDQFSALGETITSTHNLQFEEGRVYLAHYACGAYVLDVGTPDLLASPRLVGFDRGEGLRSMWDIVVHRGVMYYGDSGGVFSAQFALDARGVDGLSSRA